MSVDRITISILVLLHIIHWLWLRSHDRHLAAIDRQLDTIDPDSVDIKDCK